MIFSHEPLDGFNIERIDSENGRTYLTPEGNQYDSVTTWLGKISDKDWIKEWYARVGEIEAKTITKRASERGTRLHNNVEKYLKNEEINIADLSMLDKSLFKPFAAHLDTHVNNIKAIEYPLYSDVLRLAGTIDLCAEYDKVLSTIDFKTAKKRKNKEDILNYFLQCTIYAIMLAERYNIKANKIVIIIALDYEYRVQIFEDNAKNWIAPLMKLLKDNPPGTYNAKTRP